MSWVKTQELPPEIDVTLVVVAFCYSRKDKISILRITCSVPQNWQGNTVEILILVAPEGLEPIPDRMLIEDVVLYCEPRGGSQVVSSVGWRAVCAQNVVLLIQKSLSTINEEKEKKKSKTKGKTGKWTRKINKVTVRIECSNKKCGKIPPPCYEVEVVEQEEETGEEKCCVPNSLPIHNPRKNTVSHDKITLNLSPLPTQPPQNSVYKV